MAYHACCLMCLGYPDQALKRSQQALDLAYQIGHSFTLADVIRFGGCEFNKIRRDALSLKRYAEELICLSREKNFASWLAEGTSCLGEALVMLGHPQEGIPILREGMIDSQAMNVGLYKTISMLSLAEAHASLGDPDLAMALLIEAREFTRKSGEGHWEAELYRMRAALQEMNGEDKEAESSLKKALEVARSQEARWWELRAAIDLAHLWQKHGRDADSRQLVKGVYSWFTEGFDTPELREAREQCG
jgi:tetratricopeptide (TPR) repeat protein